MGNDPNNVVTLLRRAAGPTEDRVAPPSHCVQIVGNDGATMEAMKAMLKPLGYSAALEITSNWFENAVGEQRSKDGKPYDAVIVVDRPSGDYFSRMQLLKGIEYLQRPTPAVIVTSGTGMEEATARCEGFKPRAALVTLKMKSWNARDWDADDWTAFTSAVLGVIAKQARAPTGAPGESTRR